MATVVRIGARAAALWAVVALSVAVGASTAGAALPDGRGYELVSPADKNGAEVIPQTYKTHVRPDGDAVTFSSLGGFGGLEGSALDFEYLSRRTGVGGTSGWITHGLNPLARPLTFAAVIRNNNPTFVDAFSADLSTAIYRTWRPLVDGSNVTNVSNLYRLAGLDGGHRTVQLLSDAVSPPPEMWFTDFRGQYAMDILPQFAGVSSDLRHVVFESQLNLTADAPPYVDFTCVLAGLSCPTKLYENVDGVVRLVGRIPDGPETCDDEVGPACVAANSSQAALGATSKTYSQLAISRDGRRIYFNAPGGLYVREDGVRTERITDAGGFWTASADGSRMFFTSEANLLPAEEVDGDGLPVDDGGQTDLYMYDREGPSRLTQLSRGANPGNANSVFAATPDGHTVYFTYSGQLIDGEDPDTAQGLYRWHDGQLRYIGSFPSVIEGLMNGTQTAWNLVATAIRSRITPDGRYLLFMSTDASGFAGRGGFAGYDHAGHEEFYVYDAESGRLACASCNPNGRAATTDALLAVREAAAASVPTSDSSLALTDDGRRVFFSSAEALVPQDLNGRPDAYEYDTQAGTVHLLSSGKSTSPSYVVDSSRDGDDAFFVTRERLVGWDVDDAYDLYDARVGGGLPEPVTPGPGCAGEGCRGAGAQAPAADATASLGAGGAGDAAGRLRRHRTCRGRKVLRTVRGKRRCVKHRARRHAKRTAGRTERSGR